MTGQVHDCHQLLGCYLAVVRVVAAVTAGGGSGHFFEYLSSAFSNGFQGVLRAVVVRRA